MSVTTSTTTAVLNVTPVAPMVSTMEGTPTTISALAEQWITARSYRPASAKQRRHFVRSLVAVVGDVPPDALTADAVLAWWATTERLAPASRRSAHSAVHGFLRWCAAMGHDVPNVLGEVRRPRVPRSVPDVLTDDEVLSLELATIATPDELVVRLMLDAGLRRAEVSRLRGCDVDHDGGHMVVPGKGGNVDRVPLPPSVARLVPVGAVGRLVPITPDGVARRVQRAMARAGVEGHTAHSLRRTFATRLMASGVSAVDVMRLLRHSSLATTTAYVRSSLD